MIKLKLFQKRKENILSIATLVFQNLLVNLSLFLKKISQIDTNHYDCHISPLDLTDPLGLLHLLDLINHCQTIKVPKIYKSMLKKF